MEVIVDSNGDSTGNDNLPKHIAASAYAAIRNHRHFTPTIAKSKMNTVKRHNYFPEAEACPWKVDNSSLLDGLLFVHW